MPCCGRDRKHLSHSFVEVNYVGDSPVYRVYGVMTGKIYRFRGNGFQLSMDKRDWDTMSDPMITKIMKKYT
jgi:hypothetical protein